MTNYSVLYAEDVPHYATVTIEADSDSEIIAKAKQYDYSDEAVDVEKNSSVCKRIISIEDDLGRSIATDINLDGFLLHHESHPRVDIERFIAYLDEAEKKAWQSLARYKFSMFGYWAAIWVHLNRVGNFKRPNPFKSIVSAAREKAA